MSVQSKGVLSSSQQFNYMITWFNEFSEIQKNDFLEILCNNYNNKQTINVTTNGQTISDPTIRPMSIFQCRMKLFNQWFCLWNETEKQQFMTRVNNIDHVFAQQFKTKLNENQLNDKNEEIINNNNQSLDQIIKDNTNVDQNDEQEEEEEEDGPNIVDNNEDVVVVTKSDELVDKEEVNEEEEEEEEEDEEVVTNESLNDENNSIIIN